VSSKRLFYVGQPVICINDDFKFSRKKYPDPRISYPSFGKRYTVRSYVCGGKYPGIVLEEFTNPEVKYFNGEIREAGFWDQRFVGASHQNKAARARKKEVV
jgi:hypothetical protein